jgi:hypothetical protein
MFWIDVSTPSICARSFSSSREASDSSACAGHDNISTDAAIATIDLTRAS